MVSIWFIGLYTFGCNLTFSCFGSFYTSSILPCLLHRALIQYLSDTSFQSPPVHPGPTNLFLVNFRVPTILFIDLYNLPHVHPQTIILHASSVQLIYNLPHQCHKQTGHHLQQLYTIDQARKWWRKVTNHKEINYVNKALIANTTLELT